MTWLQRQGTKRPSYLSKVPRPSLIEAATRRESMKRTSDKLKIKCFTKHLWAAAGGSPRAAT